ncbi:MAG: mannose-1-phosphate guanylyltransferase/mannose-6-phosphate isomerase [Paracoccaceae bacterium]
MALIYPVILCGGSGTRLWPSSRKAFPKQFSSLVGEESLFQQTLRRFTGEQFGEPTVLTNGEFRFVAREQAEALGLMDANIVLEPSARDTAPAILTAALMRKDSPDDLLMVTPSDALIKRPEEFLEAIKTGAEVAAAGQIVTFGITPKSAETGYGYLELDSAPTLGKASKLKAFKEKPDAKRAEEMLQSGRHLWNAGIFLFRVKDILAEFEKNAPDMIAPCQLALDDSDDDLGFKRLEKTAYESVRAQSIDYAVMEKAKDISVVPVAAGWTDLGSWASMHSALVQSKDGVLTSGEVTAIECENSVLRCEDSNVHLVGLGVKDIVAVVTRDAVLVADINKSQQVKQVVETLRANEVAQADDYPRFHRPWGWYETLCLSDRFQVKRIMVRPGGILSLQSHVHRSEHWVVVAGTARVTVGDNVQLLSENESVYIPLGAIHRMENPGKLPMYLIEVQTGSYLGEDDIKRYEDIYDRD